MYLQYSGSFKMVSEHLYVPSSICSENTMNRGSSSECQSCDQPVTVLAQTISSVLLRESPWCGKFHFNVFVGFCCLHSTEGGRWVCKRGAWNCPQKIHQNKRPTPTRTEGMLPTESVFLHCDHNILQWVSLEDVRAAVTRANKEILTNASFLHNTRESN